MCAEELGARQLGFRLELLERSFSLSNVEARDQGKVAIFCLLKQEQGPKKIALNVGFSYWPSRHSGSLMYRIFAFSCSSGFLVLNFTYLMA